MAGFIKDNNGKFHQFTGGNGSSSPLPNISTNLATSSNYITGGSCEYIEFGDLIILNFFDVTIGNVNGNNDILFSNLPKPATGRAFLLNSLSFSIGNNLRCRIYPDGETGTIVTHYADNGSFNNTNCQLYGTFAYLKYKESETTD